MPNHVPGQHAPTAPAAPTGPTISAARGQILLTGAGFLPRCPVTVRITYRGEDIVDYVTYVSDADGFLSAALPAAALTADRGHEITATDHRRDLAGDSGLLWSNTVVVAPTGR
jgi:hypothetical protein